MLDHELSQNDFCGIDIIKILTIAFMVLMGCLLIVQQFDYESREVAFLLIIMVSILLLFLVRFYILVSTISVKKSHHQYLMKIHVALHLVPISYLFLLVFYEVSYFLNSIYFILIWLFFITGRITWLALYHNFQSKMYLLFFKGNTGMLIGPSILMGLGLFYDPSFSTHYYTRVIKFYFISHFMLTGIAIHEIEKDVRRVESKK